ncbi:MAG TPA: SMI1/KNR4 family protein [Polyangia bacterium]|nr:SMI1/KNR4 family protein [Polyangia bacterium]
MSRFYFDRFREALQAYAEGVHRLGAPVEPVQLAAAQAQLGQPLPPTYRDFLASWDGVELFHDELRVWGAQACAAENLRARAQEQWPPAMILCGVNAGGDRFAIEAGGANAVVHEFESETGLRWVAASCFARWLERVMAEGSLIYDREGEFKSGRFEGEGLSAPLRLKRARRAAKIDPDASKVRYELGKALADAGEPAAAERELARAVELDPGAIWAWFDLGRLRLSERDFSGAEAAFVRATAADPEFEHAGYFAAWAARAALARHDADAAAAHRARALALDPALPARQVLAAQHELAAGARREALELVELALAVSPRDMQALELKRRASSGRAR